MKIAVVSANGRSGQAFVELALKAGHEVVAGVYGHHDLPDHSPNLQIMSCDATDEADLEHLFAGVDAVASFIGHGKDSSPDVQTDAMRHIINVMKKLKVKRIVSLTGTGVRRRGDIIPLFDKIINSGVMVWDPARVTDGRNHVGVLEKSRLDWTVIRVLKLSNSDPKPFALRDHGPTKLFTSRHEVAQAVLQVLEDGSFIEKCPIIT